MTEAASALSAWESFHVIVGSSGGALIGLQFVVITLIAERRRGPMAGALSAFGTPTVVHLAGALLVAAIVVRRARPQVALFVVGAAALGLLLIGILGSGLMGAKLGTLFARAGHAVVFSYTAATRNSSDSRARPGETHGPARLVTLRATPMRCCWPCTGPGSTTSWDRPATCRTRTLSPARCR